MIRQCDHEFHILQFAEPDKYIANGLPAKLACGVITCAYCGQVRHLYPDGHVVIVVKEGNLHQNGYPQNPIESTSC